MHNNTLKKLLQEQALQETSSGFSERLAIQVTDKVISMNKRKSALNMALGKVVITMLILFSIILLSVIGFATLPSSTFIIIILTTVAIISVIALINYNHRINNAIINNNQE